MHIGPHELPNRVLAAPMAGIADQPLRRLWRRLGAGYVVGEMASADPRLRGTEKSRRRLAVDRKEGLAAVQLAGADPLMLADGARHAVDQGAQVIDINMGCPAKKVCNAACGSALLRDEDHVARILQAVVAAVDVPVTLKFRTGWSPEQRNAVRIARLAEATGVQMLTLHGRTRACGFRGHAEYDSIAAVKAAVRIPVVANGDIDSAAKALDVLRKTGADAVMIGRAAQQRPWLFGEIHDAMEGRLPRSAAIAALRPVLLEYLDEHFAHYEPLVAARTVRKRIGALVRGMPGEMALCAAVNASEDPLQQRKLFDEFLLGCASRGPEFVYIDEAQRRGHGHDENRAFENRAFLHTIPEAVQ
jgi:tRNA-dihydrouridine synthase B